MNIIDHLKQMFVYDEINDKKYGLIIKYNHFYCNGILSFDGNKNIINKLEYPFNMSMLNQLFDDHIIKLIREACLKAKPGKIEDVNYIIADKLFEGNNFNTKNVLFIENLDKKIFGLPRPEEAGIYTKNFYKSGLAIFHENIIKIKD